MNTWYFVAIVMVSVPFVWEVVTLVDAGLLTISEVWAHIGRQWNPFAQYGLSTLVGHWFLRPEHNVAQYVGEVAEVFLVVWAGWGIFGYFWANQDTLPLPTWANFSIILFGILMGGWCWTIGS